MFRPKTHIVLIFSSKVATNHRTFPIRTQFPPNMQANSLLSPFTVVKKISRRASIDERMLVSIDLLLIFDSHLRNRTPSASNLSTRTSTFSPVTLMRSGSISPGRVNISVTLMRSGSISPGEGKNNFRTWFKVWFKSFILSVLSDESGRVSNSYLQFLFHKKRLQSQYTLPLYSTTICGLLAFRSSSSLFRLSSSSRFITYPYTPPQCVVSWLSALPLPVFGVATTHPYTPQLYAVS